MTRHAVAEAHPNIALIKYWGNRDQALRLPSNGSISMTLDGLTTVTRVRFDPSLREDTLSIDDRASTPAERGRVSAVLDLVRDASGQHDPAEVVSRSNFPVAAGLASSASAFAALALAAAAAAGLTLDPPALSRLARRGSGSACRSIFGGYVEWTAGTGDNDSIASPLAAPDHWNLVDVIAVVNAGEKPVGSSEGHRLAATSPLQSARIADAPRRLELCRQAILRRDFAALAQVVEHDSHAMHAVMMTSSPPLFYWTPASVAVMQTVAGWRRRGLEVCFTLDAGPNVHCLCTAAAAEEATALLRDIPGVQQIIPAGVGGDARLLPSSGPGTPLL